MNPQGGNWQYTPAGGQATAEAPRPAAAAPPAPPPPTGGSVSWTASEYIEHDRNSNWYMMLVFGTIVLAALVYLITRDLIATSFMPVLGIVVGLYARRKPRQLTYSLDESGLRIGEKFYPYSHFKAFTVSHDDALPSINLEPMKRFMPPIGIYFAAQDEEQIISVLGSHLPYQEHQSDRIDQLTRRLKL